MSNPLKIKVIFLSALLLLATLPMKANALIEVPTFRLELGKSMLNFTAGTLFSTPTPLGSTATINPKFLWDIPGVRSRLGLNFLAEIGSNNYGNMTISGIGLTGIFYPLGLSSSREVHEDLSVMIKHRTSPYLQFQITPVKCAISNATTYDVVTARASYFSATIVETMIGAGLDYPLADDMIGFVGLNYRYAAFTSEETTTGVLKYNGLEIALGIMTNFF